MEFAGALPRSTDMLETSRSTTDVMDFG